MTEVEQFFVKRPANRQPVQLDCQACGCPQDELVILLHGFPENRQMWQTIMRDLASQGFFVVAPNLRGYGQSTPAHYRDDVYYDQLVTDIDAIKDHLGKRQFHLVGHDWGGAITWVYSQYRPQNLLTFTAINAPHPAAMRLQTKTNWQQLFRSWYFLLFNLPFIPEFCLSIGNFFWLRRILQTTSNPGSFSQSMLDNYCRDWQNNGTLKSMLMYYRAAFSPRNTISVPHVLTTPCMILWGEKDIALTLQTAKTSLTFTQLGKLYTFADATHWLCHDKPNEVTQRLIQHLQQNTVAL